MDNSGIEDLENDNVFIKVKRNKNGLTKKEFDESIRIKVKNLDILMEQNLITIDEYNYTKDKLYAYKF